MHTGWHTDTEYGYGIRIWHTDSPTSIGQIVHIQRLHVHGYISTACPQSHSHSHLTRICSMAQISSKLYNYMLQQDDILCLHRQIKKKKKANNMRSIQRWWIHPILLEKEEQGTYYRLTLNFLECRVFLGWARLYGSPQCRLSA